MEVIVIRNVRKEDKEDFRKACKNTGQTMSGYFKNCMYDKIRELSYLDRVK